MTKVGTMLIIAGISALTGCATSPPTAPVAVDVPGVPSPELALQKSIDRVHDFLGSLNERVDTPVRFTVALPTTSLASPGSAAPALPVSYIVNRPTSSTAEAMPLYGRGGVAWFAFGDGYPRIHCAPGSSCVIRFAPGETVAQGAFDPEPAPGWHATLVRGTRGIHAGWAVVLTTDPNASQVVFHLSTNRRTYSMLLDPTPPSMRTVAFTYAPSDPMVQPQPPQGGAAGSSTPSGPPDFSYSVSGAKVPWTPIRVYADGAHTYIQFTAGAIAASPRLVVIAPAEASSQPYRVVGDSYVVDSVVTQAMLIGRSAGAPTVQITHVGKVAG